MTTYIQARALWGRALRSRFFLGGLLLLLIAGTRWAWIDCDGGTASLTEYGYFQTDEGFYSGGGKQKFVYDQFINATRASPCTYAICPATHLFTWGAFLLFGQTTWAHRVFPFLLSTIAWLALFHFLSRRTLPRLAFLLCGICLLNPFLIVYGRTACNDVLMGSIVILGYVLARRRGLLFPLLGGLVFGLGFWVKMSVWILFLLGLGAAGIASSSRERGRRMLVCAAAFAASALLQYGLIRLMVYRDALAQDLTISQLMQISNSSYPLPNPFDLPMTFRGISSFPRPPTGGLLGIWIPLFLVLPGLLLLRRLSERPIRWDGRLLLYLTPPLYAAGIMILPVYYAHYFIPVIAFVPLLWFEARHDIRRWSGGRSWKGVLLALAAILTVMTVFYSVEVPGEEAELLNDYLANAYSLPQKMFWLFNGFYILGTAALLTFLVFLSLPRPDFRIMTAVLAGSLLVANFCFSRLPLSEAYKYTTLFSPTLKDMAYLSQVVCIALLFAVWAAPRLFRSIRWYLFFAVLFVAGVFANPKWRDSLDELLDRGHLHRKAVAELAGLIPDNAVVFGERAPQLLLSLKARVSPLPNANPVPTVLKVHAKYPDRPLFALLDSEHNYHYTHYEDNKDKIRYDVIHTLKLPGFSNNQPTDVFLLRLHVVTNPVPAPPGS